MIYDIRNFYIVAALTYILYICMQYQEYIITKKTVSLTLQVLSVSFKLANYNI